MAKHKSLPKCRHYTPPTHTGVINDFPDQTLNRSVNA
jgi:hypothetical protein